MSKNDDGEKFAKVPTWLQDQALALGIGPNGIAVYAALYMCADWTTGITTGASLGRIARLAGMASRRTAATTIDALITARVVKIPGDGKKNRAHVYKIALEAPFAGGQKLSTRNPDAESDAEQNDEAESAPGGQDLSTRWSSPEHPGGQDLTPFRSTDLSRSLKPDPSGLGGAKPDKSGDSPNIGYAVSSPEQTEHLASDESAPTRPTGDLPSTKRGASRGVPRRAVRAATEDQIRYVQDLRLMTDENLGDPLPRTSADAHAEIGQLTGEIKRLEHRGEPLAGNYWDLSPRARAYVDEHDLDIDRREAS